MNQVKRKVNCFLKKNMFFIYLTYIALCPIDGGLAQKEIIYIKE